LFIAELSQLIVELPTDLAAVWPKNSEATPSARCSDGAVIARLPEAYCWLIVPEQVTPQAPITWQTVRLAGGEALAARASKKLRHDELMIAILGSTILRKPPGQDRMGGYERWSEAPLGNFASTSSVTVTSAPFCPAR
jgi:hypothetical protein